MAMPVHQGAPLRRPKCQRKPACRQRAGDKLFEQQRLARHGGRRVTQAQIHHQQLVAQREQAGGFQADDGDAPLGQRQQRGQQLAGAGLGRVGQAGGQHGAAAALRLATLAMLAAHGMHGVAGGLQHAHCGQACA